MFKLLMEATEKKLKIKEKRAMIKDKKAMLQEKKAMLEEKKVKIVDVVEDTKMLSLNLESLNVDTRMIVQAVPYKMLQRHKDDSEAADKEDE